MGEVIKEAAAGATTVKLYVSDGTAGLFLAEMVNPKAWLAGTIINGAGNVTDGQTAATYVTNSWGYPYNVSLAAGGAALNTSGFTSGRADTAQLLTSQNLYTIYTIGSSKLIGADVETTKNMVRSICHAAAEMGMVLVFLAHNEGEISTTAANGWAAILDVLAEFSGNGITVTSAQLAASAIRAAPWTYTAGTGISTRTYTTYSDCRLQSGSPAINAGVNICTGVDTPLTGCTGAGTGSYTDFVGTKVPTGAGIDIGAYENEHFLSAAHGISGRSDAGIPIIEPPLKAIKLFSW